MKKKKLLSISLLCLFGMIVTACGGKPSSQPESQPASENPSSEVTPASSNEPGTSEAVNPSSAAPSSQASSSQAPSSAQPSSEAPVNPTGVTLDKQSASVIKGQTLQLTATVAPANANNKEITWSSSDEDVITVSKTGLVTAVEVGSAKITAKIKNTQLKAECEITVIKEINSISIKNKDAFTGFIVDDSDSLNIEIDPADNAVQLMNAGALKVTSSNTQVAAISGLTVTALKAGTATIKAELFGKQDSFELTVGDAIPGTPYSIINALNKGIQEAPWNGSTGKNGAITTTCFELQGRMIALAPNGATGYNAILDDGTQAVYLQINKLEADPIPFEVGDYAKVTCKFINYYGLLEGVSRKAATGDNASWIPSKDVEKIATPADAVTPSLSAPVAMSADEYVAYYNICKTNGTKNAAGATWTSLKYVSIEAEYKQAFADADKGGYKISDDYGLAPIGSFQLDEPVEGHKSTLEAFLIGANTGKGKSNAIVTAQTPLAVQSFTLDQGAQTIVRGNSIQLTYTTTPAGSYSRTAIWTSSDQTVATVNESGLVTGIYEGEGTKSATISVTIGEITQSVVITVFGEEAPATAVSLNQTSGSLFIGQTLQLVATPTPAMITDTAVWTSDNSAVASVDENGLVTAVAVGSANVTVRYNADVSASCAITVTEDTRWNTDFTTTKVASIELPASGDTADKYYVVCEVTAITNTKYGNGNAVDKDGTEFAIYGMYNFNGKTRYDSMSAAEKPVVGDIVVLYGVFTKYNNAPEIKNAWVVQRNGSVFQAPALTGITLSASTLELEVGGEQTLSVNPVPEDAELGTVTWSSSAEAVATVNNGKVTAVAAGTATITATVGDFSESCAVTVSAGSGEQPVTSTIELTAANVLGYSGSNIAYPTDSTPVTATVSGMGVAAVGCGCYGDGIQMRTKNGITSAIYNTTEVNLNKVQFVWAASKDVTAGKEFHLYVEFSNVADFSTLVGSKTKVHVDETTKLAELAPTAAAKYFRVTHGNQGAVYLDAIKVVINAGTDPVEPTVVPLPIIAKGNQDTKVEGAGAWIYLNTTGLDLNAELAAAMLENAEINLTVAMSDETPEGVQDAAQHYVTGADAAVVVVAEQVRFDDFGTNTVRLYIGMDKGLDNSWKMKHTFEISIPLDEETVFEGSVVFVGGELRAINGEAYVPPVVIEQPVGTYYTAAEITDAGKTALGTTNGIIPIIIKLAEDKTTVEVNVNGQSAGACSIKSFDASTGDLVITTAAFGDLSMTYDPDADSLTKLAVVAASGILKYNGGQNLRGNDKIKYWNCDGTTEELQAEWNRRYGDPWTLDTNNADRVTQNTEHAISGSAMRLRPYADNRFALATKDFAQPFNARNISFWVYNSGSADATIQCFAYKSTGYSNFIQPFGNKTIPAGQWTFISAGFTATDLYGFQIFVAKTASTLIFDDICLY